MPHLIVSSSASKESEVDKRVAFNAMFYIPQLLDRSGFSPELMLTILSDDWMQICLISRRCPERLMILHDVYGSSNAPQVEKMLHKIRQASQEYLKVSSISAAFPRLILIYHPYSAIQKGI